MTINEEAIEAAKEALYGVAGKRFIKQPQPPWSEGRKDAMTEAYQDELARAALEAAAPLLMAQAWDEGSEAGELHQFKVSRFLLGFPDPYPDDLANPYRKEQP